MTQIISCVYLLKKQNMCLEKIQNIQVRFINQLERTMKIVVCKMWISKNETHFFKKIVIIFEIAFNSFKSKGVVD